VNLSAKPEFISLREHHAKQNIRFRRCVNKIFLFIFWRCLARIMPACKHSYIYKHASKSHAKPNPAMQCLFAPVSTSVRKRGKTPEIGIIVEIKKND
jgi:hypothetical protein